MGRRDTPTTLAPASTTAAAIPAPIPWLVPVTTTTWPLKGPGFTSRCP